MTGTALRATLFVVGLAAVAALPLAGRALRADRGERCELDGVAIDVGRRVRVVEANGRARRFCCVDCARHWLAQSERRPQVVVATDETTGREVDVADAWFVRSRVVAFAVTGSHVHVFADAADARRHADAFGGDVVRWVDPSLSAGD